MPAKKSVILFTFLFSAVMLTACRKEETRDGVEFSPAAPVAGQEITFSTPYHQTSYTCSWGFGDTQVGNTAYGQIGHIYSAAGDYVVSVTIYDQDQNVQWAFSETVTVNP